MILTGRGLCLPSPATVQELFSVARDAGVVPDVSLDPVLTTFLSVDSSAALRHQYVFLQRSMSAEQRAAFRVNLTQELGGPTVTHGGVGVVALALSVLFEQVAQQTRTQGPAAAHPPTNRPEPTQMFGISASSRIGRIIHGYLSLVPGVANDRDRMAETTELFDGWLKRELLDHYERMTTKKRMSTESMQQWTTGAAFHLHLRIHQVRLGSVPVGSVESLRLSYKTGLNRLVQGYTAYLRRNIQEIQAPPPQKPKTEAPNPSSVTNATLDGLLFNVNALIPADELNGSTTPSPRGRNSTDCDRGEPCDDFGLKPNTSAGYEGDEEEEEEEEEEGRLGVLVIEPRRNVSHSVQHHPCQSQAIQQALVTRIIKAQDLERSRNFFTNPSRVFHGLLRQNDDFELRNVRLKSPSDVSNRQ